MTRYERVEQVVGLVQALHTTNRGLTIDEIRERFGVSRRTAERMRDVVGRLFPSLSFRLDATGRRCWYVPSGRSGHWILHESESAALSAAIERAQSEGANDEAASLKELLVRLRSG